MTKTFDVLGNTYYVHKPPAPQPPGPPTAEVIPPGVYTIVADLHRGLGVRRVEPFSDKLIRFPKGNGAELLDEINDFLTPEVAARYRKYGYAHRRGILLHGKPGTGKTSLFNQIMTDFVAAGGACLYNPYPGNVAAGVSHIRRGNPSQKVLVLFEELEDWIGQDESSLLQLLDGMASFDNFVVLAATNYLGKIPARFKYRPSRFAVVQEHLPPNQEMRMAYLMGMIPAGEHDYKTLAQIAEQTEGFVLDGLKDVVISVFCLQLPIAVAVEKARHLQKVEALEAVLAT